MIPDDPAAQGDGMSAYRWPDGTMHLLPPPMATDPLVASIKEVRREWRKTPPGMLQTLLDEQSRWKRKLTIAQNKLAAVREDIDRMANAMAAELAKERTDK